MLRSWGVELLPLLASVRSLVAPKYMHVHVPGLHDIMYNIIIICIIIYFNYIIINLDSIWE